MLIVFDSVCTVFGSVTILVVDYQYSFIEGMVTNCYRIATGRLRFVAKCFSCVQINVSGLEGLQRAVLL